MASIFSKIIAGDIPSFKVYENEWVYSFLDIRPVQAGHTLIVPKKEVDYFADVEDPYYTEVFKAAKSVSRALKTVTDCDRVGLIVAGYEVPHFHLHLIPTEKMSDLDFSLAKEMPMDSLKNLHGHILKELNL